MSLVFRSLHAASKPDLLNEEWLLLENTGPGVLNAAGWSVTVARQGQRPRPLGTLSPGFIMQPGDKVRLITGSPGKKSLGTPPTDEAGVKLYYLFLREPVLARPGLVLRIALNQAELARAVFAPDRQDGLSTPTTTT